MAQNRQRRSCVSSRIQTIMNSVQIDQEFPTVQHLETNSMPSTARSSTCSNISQRESKYARMNNNDLVNLLYQEPYSMTSQVFKKFNETQITHSSQLEETLEQQLEKHNILYCHESIPPSPIPSVPQCIIPEILDYDSDDCVKDKDYQPCDEVFSDDTEYGYDMQRQTNEFSNLKSNPILKKKRSTVITFPKKLITRRHTLEFTRTEEIIGHPLPKKRRTSVSIIDCSISTDLLDLGPPSSTKRKKHDISLKDRLVEKENERRSKYNVKTGCGMKYTKRCSTIFTPEERLYINNQYWNMTHSERRLFIRSNYTVAVPKRKCVQEPKRNSKRAFTLQKSDGILIKACKVFFLTTLGYCKKNDKILLNSLNPDKDIDKRASM